MITTPSARTRHDELEDLIHHDPGRFRVLTGDRPTGLLHLGHYFGTLQNLGSACRTSAWRCSCSWPTTRCSPTGTSPTA